MAGRKRKVEEMEDNPLNTTIAPENDPVVISQAEELVLLRQKVAQLEADRQRDLEQKAADQSVGELRLMNEMRKLKNESNKDGLMNIQVKEIAPKHISLWHVSGHNIGKRIGPIHPNTAEDTMMMFLAKGIKVSVTRPTDQEIEQYKATPEYKSAFEKERIRRAAKDKNKSGSAIERLAELIARDRGIPVHRVNEGILPEPVKNK